MSSTAIVPAENRAFFRPKHVPESFKKAVGVVQVAMGDLGLLHRKCYNVALANAYEGLGQGERTFRVSVAVVADWCNFNSHNYQALYDVFAELRKTPVKSITFDQKETAKGKRRRISGDGLISSFAVIEGGILEYSFSDHMAEILHEPEQYIWLSLHAQNKFDSKYELNLFENCVRYIQVGTTGFKPIDDWRILLGANERYYDNFKNFNSKVIKKATVGVNDKSGILLTPELQREKRKVTRIKFDVRENPQMQLFEHEQHKRIRGTEAYAKLRKLGLADVEAIYWIEKKGEQSVLETSDYVAGKQPDNPAGYLVTALKGGYGEKSPEERQLKAEAKERAKQLKAEREAGARVEAEHKALAERHRLHRHARTQEVLSGLSEAELAEVVEAVSENIPLRPAAKAWEKIGRDPRRVGELGRSYFAVVGTKLAEVVLARWGEPADNDLEAFKRWEAEQA